MIFPKERDELRRFYVTVWQKFQEHRPLEPLEQLIADVIHEHPEYHALLADPDAALTRDFLPEAGDTNPFLHMGLHIAIREQLGADLPRGVRAHYQRLLAHSGSAHETEHRMMECLAECLWQGQTERREPDMARYLACLERLTGPHKSV